MIKKWRIKIPSLTGTKTRRAYIYVPDEAFEHPEARYPVLYMFDGHNVFFDSDATYGKSWGMAEYVEETKLPMIIAAVECNHSPPLSIDTYTLIIKLLHCTNRVFVLQSNQPRKEATK